MRTLFQMRTDPVLKDSARNAALSAGMDLTTCTKALWVKMINAPQAEREALAAEYRNLTDQADLAALRARQDVLNGRITR